MTQQSYWQYREYVNNPPSILTDEQLIKLTDIELCEYMRHTFDCSIDYATDKSKVGALTDANLAAKSEFRRRIAISANRQQKLQRMYKTTRRL